jgi:hypothetical protein
LTGAFFYINILGCEYLKLTWFENLPRKKTKEN